jgi:transcriptional regulator with XRE-family HTH domain
MAIALQEEDLGGRAMSNFGELMRRLRRERGWSLKTVARMLDTQKGYLSGIENGKVNPPSEKIVKRIADLYGQEERMLLRLAWADKAPTLIREEAVRMVHHADLEDDASPEVVSVRLLNPDGQPYPAEVDGDGVLRPAGNTSLVLPRSRPAPEFAALINDDSMDSAELPRYRRGEAVLLTRAARLDRAAVVYIVFRAREGARALIRKAVPEEKNALVLQPLNEKFPLEFIEAKEVVALYRTVGRIEMFAQGLTG